MTARLLVMLNLCRAIVNFANEGHVISAVYELEPDGTSKRVAYRGLPEYQKALKDPEPDVIVAKFATNFSSGASFASKCRVNQKSREVFDIETSGTPSDYGKCRPHRTADSGRPKRTGTCGKRTSCDRTGAAL